MTLPRLLTIMGSGETTPTMARVHRGLLDRLGPRPVPAALLDTPYGFQENADDITARALDYFRESVGHPLAAAPLRGGESDLARETALTRLREAAYVFSGPGSPTYALRVWAATDVPRVLAAKLRPGGDGGAITVASAAALTVGRFTLPVYEVYKAGEEAHWLPGLDLLSPLGLPVAVVPHYDNAEGGNHDTRYCYMGERRLARLEAELPDDVFILGVDGHTALVLDLDEGTASVLGLGTVTVRHRGESTVFESGTIMPIGRLTDAARADHVAAHDSAGHDSAGDGSADRPRVPVPVAAPPAGLHPLREEVGAARAAFERAMTDGDPAAAAGEVLMLEARLVEWSRDTEQSSELDDARGALRSMIVRLGEAGVLGTRDPAETVGPFVDALVELRLRARADRDWAAADAIRDRLLAAGVEIHDTADGTTWELHRGQPVG